MQEVIQKDYKESLYRQQTNYFPTKLLTNHISNLKA